MPVKIDIIILSYAKNEELKNLTIQTIQTLLASEDPKIIEFDILVIESNKKLSPYQFENTKTIYPAEKFGFNKYLNIGINNTVNPYLCLCNNDLIFHKGWASEMLKAMDNDPALLSATPYCPNFHKKEGFNENSLPIEGYYGVLIGWCIFIKRELFDIIGLLDEKFEFWYSDADFCQNLVKYQIKNCLISTSFVTHIGSESLKAVDEKTQQKLTQLPRFYYSYKWHHHSWLKYKLQTAVFKVKLLLGL